MTAAETKIPDLTDGAVDLAEGMFRFGTAEVILAILGMVFLIFGIAMIAENRKDRAVLRRKQEEDDKHYKSMFEQNVKLNTRALDLIEGNREMHIAMGVDIADVRSGVDKIAGQNDETHRKLDVAIELVRDVARRTDDCGQKALILSRAANAMEKIKAEEACDGKEE